jgi:hypothetical protein
MNIRLFKKIILAATTVGTLGPVSFAQDNYCIALRGNGELKPAHWGALAQTIETFGVPEGMSGGSSASISIFLMESVMMNPLVRDEQDPVVKARNAAFLVKSFEGFVYAFLNRKDYQHFVEVLKTVQSADKNIGLFGRFAGLIAKKSTFELLETYNDVTKIIDEILSSHIFYGEQVQRFSAALGNAFGNLLSDEAFQELEKEHSRLKDSLAVFGKFNAKDDLTLFVRDGVVNFPKLNSVFNFMANFYSERGATEKTQKALVKLINTCAQNSGGKSWRQITRRDTVELSLKPNCQALLSQAVESYFIKHDESSPRIKDPVGQFLPTLISTSVVEGTSRELLIKMKTDFLKGINPDFNSTISSSDLKFGYWGKEKDLTAVRNYFVQHADDLLVSIDKSKRFKALGEATWETVLALSPAEPGLSPMLPFVAKGEDLISLGGWSDLHPVPVLKARGCDKVVYITRRGGEALFAQGVAKRLLGFPGLPWEAISPDEADSNPTPFVNNRGQVGPTDQVWSNMFNLANPQSSFSVSLALADAVICTDWNSFNVKTEFKKLIDDSYTAPIYMPNPMKTLGLKNVQFISRQSNIDVTRLSLINNKPLAGQVYPKYTGCIPQTAP